MMLADFMNHISKHEQEYLPNTPKRTLAKQDNLRISHTTVPNGTIIKHTLW